MHLEQKRAQKFSQRKYPAFQNKSYISSDIKAKTYFEEYSVEKK